MLIAIFKFCLKEWHSESNRKHSKFKMLNGQYSPFDKHLLAENLFSRHDLTVTSGQNVTSKNCTFLNILIFIMATV